MHTTEKYQVERQLRLLLTWQVRTQCLVVLDVHNSLHCQQLSKGLLLPGAAPYHRAKPTTHQNQFKSPADAFLLLALKYILLLSEGFKSLVISSCTFESLGHMSLTQENESHECWRMSHAAA